MTESNEVVEELQQIPWFQELKPQHVRKIAAITDVRDVKAGEVLFREGDKEDFVYIVLDGRVALDMFVPHRGKVRFYTAEPWEIFGWSSVTPTVRQRTAGATAVIDSRVARIDAQRLRQACDEDHDLGYQVMRRLANVVAGRLLGDTASIAGHVCAPGDKKWLRSATSKSAIRSRSRRPACDAFVPVPHGRRLRNPSVRRCRDGAIVYERLTDRSNFRKGTITDQAPGSSGSGRPIMRATSTSSRGAILEAVPFPSPPGTLHVAEERTTGGMRLSPAPSGIYAFIGRATPASSQQYRCRTGSFCARTSPIPPIVHTATQTYSF